MRWFKAFKASYQKASAQRRQRELLARADTMMAETDAMLQETAGMLKEIAACSPEERAWLEWFYGLPESQKTLVEGCAEHGIKVTPDNIEAVLAHMAKEPA
jgi:hypothetical protein